jgi:hypothetical protein
MILNFWPVIRLSVHYADKYHFQNEKHHQGGMVAAACLEWLEKIVTML